jgi:hypothetical protein
MRRSRNHHLGVEVVDGDAWSSHGGGSTKKREREIQQQAALTGWVSLMASSLVPPPWRRRLERRPPTVEAEVGGEPPTAEALRACASEARSTSSALQFLSALGISALTRRRHRGKYVISQLP